MARGWESKSVEDQIGAAEVEKARPQTPARTMQEREHQQRKQGLLLSRSRIVNLIKVARNERYRSQLERTLKHLEAELVALDSKSEQGNVS